MDFHEPKTWVILACVVLVLTGISFVTLGLPNAPNIFTPFSCCIIVAGILKARQ